jgi:hypothetical protein
MIAVFQWARRVHGLDRAAILIGKCVIIRQKAIIVVSVAYDCLLKTCRAVGDILGKLYQGIGHIYSAYTEAHQFTFLYVLDASTNCLNAEKPTRRRP